MVPIVAALVKFGLPALASAVAAKGQEWVEGTIGEKLPPLLGPQPSDDTLLRLKQLELSKEELLLRAAAEATKADLDRFRVEVADRSSARDREVALANSNAPHIGKITTPVLAIGTVLGFFTVLAGLLVAAAQGVELAAGLKEVLYIMLGVLGTQTTSVYNYYFGSSAGSAQKNFQPGGVK